MSQPDRLTAKAVPLTERLLAETREELARADGKAQILLASTGVIVGVVLSGAIGGDWSPGDLHACSRIVWWVGVGAAGLGVGSLGYAVYPRLLKSDDARITYFEDVLRYDECSGLVRGLNAEADRGDRDAEQLFRLGRVVHRKYSAVRVAIDSFLVAVVLCAAAAFIG
jgi:hypothetical protein